MNEALTKRPTKIAIRNPYVLRAVQPKKDQNGRSWSLLSKTTKMPGPSWSIPARSCIKGSILRNKQNSVCSSCYAMKGRYRFGNVQRTLQTRLEHYNKDPEAWIETMTYAILVSDCQHFRWFDSGDLQSERMLMDIAQVCRRTPKAKHWLPTRERGFLKLAMQHITIPDNLCIRLSGMMINSNPPLISNTHQEIIQTSTVVTEGHTCPAPEQEHKCLDCRQCWNRQVPNIAYLKQ